MGISTTNEQVDKVLNAVQDPERLRVLKDLNLLDTEAEEAFDRLTRLASKVTNSPIALISLVDADRQFFKSLLGLPKDVAEKRETPLSHSFCKHVVAEKSELIVDDARNHPKVKDNLAITDLGVAAYLGMPLTTKEGVELGSFCIIDTKPRHWHKEEIETVRELALLTMTEIELRAQVKARRKAEKDRDDLINMIVHDLRNPLAVISGCFELLQLTVDKPEFESRNSELVKQGGLSTHVLNGLIDDLLNLNRLESGTLTPVFSTVSLNQLLTKRAKLYQLQAQIENKFFTMRFEPDLPVVDIDTQLIGRVIDNLINNALKYSDEEDIVELSVVSDTDELTITLIDEGAGIPEEYQELIFEKFFQVKDKSGNPLRKGSGVGLAFCKLAVEAHNGRIWVEESKEGEGSKFSFTLPIHQNNTNS